MIQLKMTHILSLVSLTQSCLYSLDIMHLMKCAPDIHQMFETHWSEVRNSCLYTSLFYLNILLLMVCHKLAYTYFLFTVTVFYGLAPISKTII